VKFGQCVFLQQRTFRGLARCRVTSWLHGESQLRPVSEYWAAVRSWPSRDMTEQPVRLVVGSRSFLHSGNRDTRGTERVRWHRASCIHPSGRAQLGIGTSNRQEFDRSHCLLACRFRSDLPVAHFSGRPSRVIQPCLPICRIGVGCTRSNARQASGRLPLSCRGEVFRSTHPERPPLLWSSGILSPIYSIASNKPTAYCALTDPIQNIPSDASTTRVPDTDVRGFGRRPWHQRRPPVGHRASCCVSCKQSLNPVGKTRLPNPPVAVVE
jgi:hypothetical protein